MCYFIALRMFFKKKQDFQPRDDIYSSIMGSVFVGHNICLV